MIGFSKCHESELNYRYMFCYVTLSYICIRRFVYTKDTISKCCYIGDPDVIFSDIGRMIFDGDVKHRMKNLAADISDSGLKFCFTSQPCS